MTYKWATPHDWLRTRVADLDRETIIEYLFVLANDLDADAIQDAFQDQMDADGYFDDGLDPADVAERIFQKLYGEFGDLGDDSWREDKVNEITEWLDDGSDITEDDFDGLCKQWADADADEIAIIADNVLMAEEAADLTDEIGYSDCDLGI